MPVNDSTASERYRNPLVERYASAEMSRIFSDGYKFRMWRRLWLALAETERELGLDIPEAALRAMRAHLDDFDLDRAAEHERRLRHDVMAHVHAYGLAAPAARARPGTDRGAGQPLTAPEVRPATSTFPYTSRARLAVCSPA